MNFKQDQGKGKFVSSSVKQGGKIQQQQQVTESQSTIKFDKDKEQTKHQGPSKIFSTLHQSST